VNGSDSVLEALLRRDRTVFVAGLVLVTCLAWTWLVLGAGMDMTAIRMTRMAGMDGWLMQQAQWTPAYAGLMVSMWWIMMTAMMLPSAAPTLLLYMRVGRNRELSGSRVVPTGVFAAGYLAVWGCFSLAATALQWGMEAGRLMSPMLQTTNVWLSSGILVAAGAWQLTPLKSVCLRHCRTPIGYLVTRWRSGWWGAFRMGLGHGAYCLGCCWFLMALLFFGGIMNLYWIVGLSAFVILEKTVPLGHWLARATGVVLLGWGLSLPML